MNPPALARTLASCTLLVVCVTLPAADLRAQAAALPEGTIQAPDGAGVWVDAPPPLPAGSKLLVLEGQPNQEGFFTMRARLPAGARIRPHWHQEAERVTILSGLVRVGFGDDFDEDAMATFGPGSFYLNPARSHHYVWIVEDTEMQLTGLGPWVMHFLDEE
jgi:hypothetical protein